MSVTTVHRWYCERCRLVVDCAPDQPPYNWRVWSRQQHPEAERKSRSTYATFRDRLLCPDCDAAVADALEMPS